MSRVAKIRVIRPATSRPDPFLPDYVLAADMATAFARPLVRGYLSFGELEDKLMTVLAGPNYHRELRARSECASFINSATIGYRVLLCEPAP